ncbi:MAG: CHAT domain-containing protein, partial [Vicinamibacteria bacterium]
MVREAGLILFGVLLCQPAHAQDTPDPTKLVEQADRLAWLRAWTRAVPLYAEADRLFTARGDRRNALYAQISKLRGELPRLPVPEVSQRLAEYLEDPVVQGDERLRLRTLIIKGETDEDLDPSLAEQSWNQALSLADKIGEPAWANRARGELGLVAFLLGDINTSVIRLGQAMKVAEANGDVPSLVRWFTLFGHGYVELGRPELALEYYDRALKLASTVPELQFPLMTHLGKGDALVKLGRFGEAEAMLDNALAVAREEGALGYQAELTLKQGLIAYERKQTDRALEALLRAMDLARKAGGNRILAQISLDLAKIQRETGRSEEAVATLHAGIDVARSMGERLLLPRLLAQLADVRVSQRRYAEARNLLEEAHDILESLLTHASSPWVRSRVLGGMDEVSVARARLEGAQGDPIRLFAVLEQAKGRSLLDLLSSTPVSDVREPAGLRAGERRIAALQLQLMRTQVRPQRRRLLDEIFAAEEQLAPISTELFSSTRTAPRTPLTLSQLQRTLRSDEVLVDFALAEPTSYAVVATKTTTRVQRLPGRDAVQKATESLLVAVREGRNASVHARSLGEMLLGVIPEIASRARVVVSPDGILHQLPFELLVIASGRPLIESHVVSYVPSGSVLAILRGRRVQNMPQRMALAVSASPPTESPSGSTNGDSPATPAVARGVYDL